MKADVTPLPLLAFGGGLVTAVLFGVRQRSASAVFVEPSTDPHAWVFPVPSLAGRPAVISDGFDSPRTFPDGTRGKHLGIDVMFRRRDPRDLLAIYTPGTANGTKGYFMPDGVPVLAASTGVVRLARSTPLGFSVVIRHPNSWATYYTHLASLAVAVGEHVVAGQTIGIIGASPADAAHLKHLHFELWTDGTRAGAVDPSRYVEAWTRISIADWAPGRAIGARNAALVYRPVGSPGEPYPDWLRRHQGSSGVYIIRERNGPIVYVGSSTADRLYETLTRHFQAWRRWKGFWKGQYAEGHDPGLTYDRDSVEVAVKVTTRSDALDEEARLIARLRPRDNVIGQPELEDAPF